MDKKSSGFGWFGPRRKRFGKLFRRSDSRISLFQEDDEKDDTSRVSTASDQTPSRSLSGLLTPWWKRSSYNTSRSPSSSSQEERPVLGFEHTRNVDEDWENTWDSWDSISADKYLSKYQNHYLEKIHGLTWCSERRRLVGVGRFGFVCRAKWQGHTKAVKIISLGYYKHKTVKEAVEHMTRELDIFCKVRHPNIVRLADYIKLYDPETDFPHPTHILLIMEEMTCSLDTFISDFLFNRYQRFSGQKTVAWLRQIVKALVYLHGKRIAHLDIKPANILYSYKRLERRDLYKLCDFGMSRELAEDEDQIQLEYDIGDTVFKAPEIRQQIIGDPFPTDIFSLGMSSMWSLCGKSYHIKDLFEDLSDWSEEVGEKYEMNRSLRDIILEMTGDEPSLRPTIVDIDNMLSEQILDYEPDAISDTGSAF